jgi:hypothetical protein
MRLYAVLTAANRLTRPAPTLSGSGNRSTLLKLSPDSPRISWTRMKMVELVPGWPFSFDNHQRDGQRKVAVTKRKWTNLLAVDGDLLTLMDPHNVT